MTFAPFDSKLRVRRSRRQGFTIVESLIMLTLLGVMTVLILSLIRYHNREEDPANDAEAVPKLSTDGSLEKPPAKAEP